MSLYMNNVRIVIMTSLYECTIVTISTMVLITRDISQYLSVNYLSSNQRLYHHGQMTAMLGQLAWQLIIMVIMVIMIMVNCHSTTMGSVYNGHHDSQS